jgi:hypothetical protein
MACQEIIQGDTVHDIIEWLTHKLEEAEAEPTLRHGGEDLGADKSCRASSARTSGHCAL